MQNYIANMHAMGKILVVDDYEMTLFAMRTLLEQGGHQVITARNGKGVADLIRRVKPDLMITDILMPEQDGLGLIGEVREFDTALPIIAVSGGGMAVGTNYLDYARDMGANAILTKPFRQGELMELVKQLIRTSPAPDTAEG